MIRYGERRVEPRRTISDRVLLTPRQEEIATMYEHALALWRALEADSDSLRPDDQARYAYLRGMTDYRLGFRADSRHWRQLHCRPR